MLVEDVNEFAPTWDVGSEEITDEFGDAAFNGNPVPATKAISVTVEEGQLLEEVGASNLVIPFCKKRPLVQLI